MGLCVCLCVCCCCCLFWGVVGFVCVGFFFFIFFFFGGGVREVLVFKIKLTFYCASSAKVEHITLQN